MWELAEAESKCLVAEEVLSHFLIIFSERKLFVVFQQLSFAV